VPLLNLRLARPSLLVDVGRLPGLDGIVPDPDGGLRLGALVRHRQLLADPLVARRVPLLLQAVRQVGHVAVRNRGTLGGSLVHADPSAELATAAVALDAELHLRSLEGERWVRARNFFLGPFMTDIRDEELLVELKVPARPVGEGSAFVEVAPRQGDFAVVAVAALVRISSRALTGVAVAWSGAASTPVLAPELGSSLEGVALEGDGVELACGSAGRRLSPPSDARTSAEYRRAALGVLAARAIRAAAS
jgi:carbon-monoxide dehydrogenase medium subunit